MFSFFKRFKGSKESDNAPEESQTAPEALAAEPAAEAPIVPVAPVMPVAPATPPAPRPAVPAGVDTQPAAAPPTNGPEAAALETVEIVTPPQQDASAKRSWLTRLKTGLSKTSSSLTGIFVGTKIDEDLYEELETALLMSDAGVEATEFLLESLREKVRTERLTDPQQVKAALRTLLIDL
ncbi:MAG: signal recognition particle receptor subunit alpha, partial [Paraburkholderia fungorum]|nr:signal recognition particle receptor subunit alpha [Paraburkholderia fungorum]